MGFGILAALAIAGTCIGATGIGGMLVVPALTQLGTLSTEHAIPVATMAFAFNGAAALFSLRKRADAGTGVYPMVLGAVPGSILGALAVRHVSPQALGLIVATLAVAGGLAALRRPEATRHERAGPTRLPLLPLGALVGFGSSITGTGGPVLLVPTLMFLRWTTFQTVAVAQAIQLPVAAAGTAVHWAAGALDLRLGTLIGMVLLTASFAGQRVAISLGSNRLRRVLAFFMMGTGVWMWIAVLGTCDWRFP
jgi:uncharacterized membrane protein YfcA